MKYSFIICYRDRAEHLKKTVLRLQEAFSAYATDHDYEIIVVEQNDNLKFRRANLLNEGAKVANGDVLIFHDVDYYPEYVNYWEPGCDVFLPVKRVEFVNMDLSPRDTKDIPGGYRHFKDSVDANFFGGVTAFTKDAFFKINGFSPLFVGWGFEDADLRERIAFHKLSVKRSADNLFYALPHPDSGPSMEDPDFRRNIELSSQYTFYLAHGVSNQPSQVTVGVNPLFPGVDVWVCASEFDPPRPASHIIASTFDFVDNE